ALTSGNRKPGYVYGPAAIGVGNHIGSKELFQSWKIASLRGHHKGVEKASLFARANRLATSISNVFARAGNKLSSVRVGGSNGVGNLIVGIVKRFSQNICGAFCRREFLE